ncbi:MAG TPA: VPDSG-CTERM sorting domain-containing protein [Chthoniobacterales bacterium]|nr:VPDSG-CTERM sorting domain-containing protein [Chthoniobacterales bacterium]
MKKLILIALFSANFIAVRINAQVLYNNDFPTNQMASATRPESTGKFEIESADDFLLPTGAHVTGATFTGLLSGGATTSDIANVRVEIYRVFPNDSDVGRTSGPPTFSTPQVPTRVNSPADVALLDRSKSDGNLSFITALLNATFTASNSVQPGGIHPQPGQTTGGNGAITGEEVNFVIDFTTPLNLPPGHYFFVPQVELSGADDNFFWLSATRPLLPPSTVFMPDLQSWTRDAALDPDWLRIGTDIVGGTTPPTFNAAFSLTGIAPDTGSTALLLGIALGGMAWLRRRSLAR